MSVLDQESVSVECETPSLGLRPYLCPVYRTSQRSSLHWHGQQDDFVMGIILPTKELPNKWVQRGVALLCNLVV
jgi:hypothetical protein